MNIKEIQRMREIANGRIAYQYSLVKLTLRTTNVIVRTKVTGATKDEKGVGA